MGSVKSPHRFTLDDDDVQIDHSFGISSSRPDGDNMRAL
jgi:hypothetical protein